MKNVKLIYVFGVVLMFAILGCGGDAAAPKSGNKIKNDSGDKEETQTSTTKTFNGVIVDGYINGAIVKIKYNGINTYIKSDANGKYEAKILRGSTLINIEASGGIDMATKEAFEGVLLSSVVPDGLIYTTPLTTLISFDVDNTRVIMDKLGLGSEVDLSKVNPLGSSISNETKINIFKATQQIQKTSEIIKDTLGDDISYKDIAKAVSKSVVNHSGSKGASFILKSNELKNNIISMVSEDKKEKSIIKFDGIADVLSALVDGINSFGIDANNLNEASRIIEVVSGSYESQILIIRDEIDSGSSITKSKQDLSNMVLSFDGLSKASKILVLYGDNPLSSLITAISDKIKSSGRIDLENADIMGGIISKAKGIEVIAPIIETTKPEDVDKNEAKTPNSSSEQTPNNSGIPTFKD